VVLLIFGMFLNLKSLVLRSKTFFSGLTQLGDFARALAKLPRTLQDEVLIARHKPNLIDTTNVGELPQFSNRLS
jgi:hypothetical protein